MTPDEAVVAFIAKVRRENHEAPWKAAGKCAGTDPALFFPGRGMSHDLSHAKAVCNGTDDGEPCCVREQCLQYALDGHEIYGVWGGTSERERRKLRRARRVA